MTGLVFFMAFAGALYAWGKPTAAPAYATASTADWDYFMAERAAAKAAKGDYT